MQKTLKTRVISGLFKEPIKIVYFDFKVAHDRLLSGNDVLCLRNNERISMNDGIIRVNFDYITHQEFINSFSHDHFKDA